MVVAIAMILIAIDSGSEVVVGCWMAFERSPVVLMVSLVLDLFVCTPAAALRAVIVASCVYVSL